MTRVQLEWVPHDRALKAARANGYTGADSQSIWDFTSIEFHIEREHFAADEPARLRAKEILDSRLDAFGAVQLQQQEFIQRRGQPDHWEDIGEVEEIS